MNNNKMCGHICSACAGEKHFSCLLLTLSHSIHKHLLSLVYILLHVLETAQIRGTCVSDVAL